jgi:hypothetical protein
MQYRSKELRSTRRPRWPTPSSLLRTRYAISDFTSGRSRCRISSRSLRKSHPRRRSSIVMTDSMRSCCVAESESESHEAVMQSCSGPSRRLGIRGSRIPAKHDTTKEQDRVSGGVIGSVPASTPLTTARNVRSESAVARREAASFDSCG